MSRENEVYGVGLVRSTSFGRKRVALSNINVRFGNDHDCIASSPPKRLCSPVSFLCAEKSSLENLPQEILIRILCGVEHDDLKRLFFVSKAIREATLIAKQTHFAYSTPRKTVGFKNLDLFGDFDEEIKAPNAPKQSRIPRVRLIAKKLTEISVSPFASDSEDMWPQRNLFPEVETENCTAYL